MARWEGATHDTRIFLDAIRRQSVNFPKPLLGIYYFYILNMYKGWTYKLRIYSVRFSGARRKFALSEQLAVLPFSVICVFVLER